jgi:CRISPR-associated endonuclease Csy4
MDYYIDIQILPNPEFLDGTLMNEIFFDLHKVLASDGKTDIGISFPNFKKALGDVLRVHGSQNSLQRLMTLKWLARIVDYINVSEITKIPESACYRVVKRIQTKSCQERLFRRSVRKGWITEEEAALKIREKSNKTLSLPFLHVKSLSTQQRFRLFIEHGPITSEPVTGKFNAYGLSSNATIPWF